MLDSNACGPVATYSASCTNWYLSSVVLPKHCTLFCNDLVDYLVKQGPGLVHVQHHVGTPVVVESGVSLRVGILFIGGEITRQLVTTPTGKHGKHWRDAKNLAHGQKMLGL